MKKIGLFGGSFDPIHNGHLHIARAFADELALEQVIFLPTGDSYHKSGERLAGAHRLAMVELAIADDTHFAVSDLDLVRGGKTYTIDTVQIFKQHFPQTQLWWLMGMDSLLQLHTWKNWRDLVRYVHIAVAARNGQTLAQAPHELHDWLGNALQTGRLKMLNAPQKDISSGDIRATFQAAKTGQISNLPLAVQTYIQQNQLYQTILAERA